MKKMIITICFCLVGFIGCGGDIPSAIKTCQTNDDCQMGGTCIVNVCVSKQQKLVSVCKNGDKRPCLSSNNSGCSKPNELMDFITCRGICTTGNEICQDGKWSGECVGEVKPSIEICGDKLDNDCNGQVDDTNCITPECKEQETRECYTGDPNTKNKGVCKTGVETCKNRKWSGECVGQVLPSQEICDKLDNDCDGAIDELPECQIECKNNETRSCYTKDKLTRNVGECKDGIESCVNSKWSGLCIGEKTPSQEICGDKLDNDCDGTIDNPHQCDTCTNGETHSCYTKDKLTRGVGECTDGIESCVNGKWSGLCIGEKTPSQEICDGKDNNCNGQIDELAECECKNNETRSCYTGDPNKRGVGECKVGTQNCVNQKWGACKGEVLPTEEICDGKDNNCDGKIDDIKPRECYTGNLNTRKIGECKDGLETCQNGKWSSCVGEVLPTKEICDRKDNDCNGIVDDSFKNFGTPCKVGKGICENTGNFVCSSDKLTTVCDAKEGTQQTEVCDGLDNDCNGVIDDPFTNLGMPCEIGTGICKGTGKFVCSTNKLTTVCNAKEGTPQKEVCNGKDDDCNGQIDELWSTIGNFCEIGKGECRNTGKIVCLPDTTGVGCSVRELPAVQEKCDGLDNNCNGLIDETFTNLGGPCTVGIGACESTGKFVCSTDKLTTVCNATEGTPQTEVCDGKDNDCNGQIDEQPGCKPECTHNQTRICYTGDSSTKNKGECKDGIQTCIFGKWDNKCVGQILPQQNETCNGKDDNCDGQIDENLTQKCYTGDAKTKNIGECKDGLETCQNGKWSSCVGEVLPKTSETCNGKDDDCDGFIDNVANASCPTFKLITMPSTATIGSNPGELGHKSDGSQNSRTVNFGNKFLYAGIHEITRAQFKGVMGYLPNQWYPGCGDNCPVNRITWHEALKYANELSKLHGLTECYTCTGTGSAVTCTINSVSFPQTCKGYRLPTQTEWEVLARAGTTGPHYCTQALSFCAFFNDSLGAMHPVGILLANLFGMYDMIGNVREWTSDGYQLTPPSGQDPHETSHGDPVKEEKVIKGCDSANSEAECHAGVRNRAPTKPPTALDTTGARLVRSWP